jgi:hypothetical protein
MCGRRSGGHGEGVGTVGTMWAFCCVMRWCNLGWESNDGDLLCTWIPAHAL